MRAAVCQVCSTDDVAANRSAAAKAVIEATSRGADLVVLPEAMQCSFAGLLARIRGAAEPLDGPFVASMREALTGTRATAVAGLFEAVPGSTKVHNTLVIVSGRRVLGRYRKLHLYDALGWRESDRVLAGDPFTGGTVVVPIGEHVVGVMTCYDLRFPEVGRVLADQGATVLVVAGAWVQGPGKAEQWRTLLQARAIENTCYVVAADQPGPETIGLSMVVDPRGHVMVSLDNDSEDIGIAELSLQAVLGTRRGLPLLEGRRFAVHPRG